MKKNTITSQPLRIHYQTFKYSVIALIVLFIPFNVIHEVGHLIPCWLSDGEGTITIGVTISQAICYGILSNSLVFAFAGGFFGMIAGILPLAIRKINEKPFLVITLTSLGLAHFVNGCVEAFARDWYMHSDFAIPVMTVTSFTIFALMLVAFGRTDRR